MTQNNNNFTGRGGYRGGGRPKKGLLPLTYRGYFTCNEMDFNILKDLSKIDKQNFFQYCREILRLFNTNKEDIDKYTKLNQEKRRILYASFFDMLRKLSTEG